MKIAFLTHRFPRLYNSFILNEIVALKKAGHDVLVVSLGRPVDSVTSKDIERYRLLDCTLYLDTLARTSMQRDPSLRAYSKFLKDDFSRLEALADRLVCEGCDIIHAAFGNRPATAAMVVSKLSGIPFTFETHAYDLFVDFPFPVEKANAAAAVITESSYNKAFLVDLGCDAEKINIVHLAPNVEYLDSLPAIERKKLLLVSACRLHPIKGLSLAVEAVAHLRRKYPEIKYCIIGDGPDEVKLRELVVKHNLTNTVKFLGAMSNEEVALLVKQAAMFVLPCVIAENGDRDGTPTAIAEAMYLETPVISTRISGIPEMIEEGANGLLTDPGNIVDLVATIDWLLRNEESGRRMGTKARMKIAEDFNIGRSTAQLIDLWEQLIKRNGQAECRL